MDGKRLQRDKVFYRFAAIQMGFCFFYRVGQPGAAIVVTPAQIEHQPADRIGRIAAIVEQLVAGFIPGGGLVIALIFVQAFNLPLEIAAIVGGIYRLIDMGSTTINCMGDMVGTTIVAYSEERRLKPT